MIAGGAPARSVPILFAILAVGSTGTEVTDTDLDLALLQLKGEVTARARHNHNRTATRRAGVSWTEAKMTSCGTNANKQAAKCADKNELEIGELVHEPMGRYGLTGIEEHQVG